MKTKSNKQIDIRRAALIELSIKARAYREEQLNNANTEQQLLYWSAIRINDIIEIGIEKKAEQQFLKPLHNGKLMVSI